MIPNRGTKIPHAVWHGQKKKRKKGRKKDGSLMNERFQQVLRIWKEDESSYEQNRWKQQLRTLSKPAKGEVGAS